MKHNVRMNSKICKWCGNEIPKSEVRRKVFCSSKCARQFSRLQKRSHSQREKSELESEDKPLGYPGYLIEWLLDGYHSTVRTYVKRKLMAMIS